MSLEAECSLLCRQAFGVEPPAGFSQAYQRAHAVVFAEAPIPPAEAAWIAEAVRRGWDLESMEFAQRLQKKPGALSKKFNIVFYLREASPQGFPDFVAIEPARLKAWSSLAFETLRSAYKLLKGRLLLWRLPHD